MKPPTWSLRALLASVVLLAVSLGALRNPTDTIAFVVGLAVAAAMLAAVAIALGSRGIGRRVAATFALVCASILYLDQNERHFLTALPSYHDAAAGWLNERFGWAEWKGPPKTFVYWTESGQVRHVSFDHQGNFRSLGAMSIAQAERRLRGAVVLESLPTECPVPRPSRSALGKIVSLVSAVGGGLLASLLAHTVSRSTR